MNPEVIKAAALAWERGKALQKAGKYREAEPHFRAALKVMPQSAALLSDYGTLAEQLDDWRAAENIWRAVGKVDPSRAVEGKIGLALLQQDRAQDALPVLEAFARRSPADPDIAINIAVALTRLGRDGDAIATLQDAVRAQPGNRLAWESLATLLINAQDRIGAGAALDAACARFPDAAELRYLRMDHLLKSRAFGEGFDLFDARWGTRFFGGDVARRRAQRWDGKPFDGRLLVRAEQGVGDELLYSSLFGDVAGRHPDTTIECDARLEPLFRRAWPLLHFVTRPAPDAIPEPHGFDRETMAGDLCRIFRRNESDFPVRSHWLAPDATLSAAIAAEYRARFPGQLLVGLSWRSIHPTNGTAKSLALGQLLPLLRLPGVRFIDLQYGDTSSELAALAADHGVEIHHDARFDSLKDLDGFAAQLGALDLVISTSNSTVHLAGALGVPTWVLLHHDRGLSWYWAYEGESVPWYPNTRLIRCRRRGEWEPVISEAARRLAELPRPAA